MTYNNGMPLLIRIESNGGVLAQQAQTVAEAEAYLSATASGYVKSETTLDIMSRYNGAYQNPVRIAGFYITETS